ncbi:uncharacterized protein LOC123664653 [Melitaea cinxia]|uniref:uncharacterized protein LOC123664653 n=1 Tax=Melitaea cinxia TaxID=113334 RepID=UPI001E273929|nr:uncharacterized protein LOC123664653 [Melitaea cinxia]
MAIVEAYFSPIKSVAEFEAFLDGTESMLRRFYPREVLVLGDLNTKSRLWGCPATDARGAILEEWLVATDLTVLNRGTANTCVRRSGGSIVDVSFASPGLARRVRDWRVLDDVETLSDHRYVRFEISARPAVPPSSSRASAEEGPRWQLQRFDRERLDEAAIVASSHVSLPVVTEYPVAQARALHPVTRQRLTRRTGTPYSYPSYQPAVLPPEGAGYPQGFAPAAGLPPSRAEPYSTYPSAPRVPNANGVLGLGKGKKKAGKLGAMEKKELPVETDPEKLVNYVCGSNIYVSGEDVKLKDDSEYPDWLWTLHTGKPPSVEELDPNTKQYWIRVRAAGMRRNNRLRAMRKF